MGYRYAGDPNVWNEGTNDPNSSKGYGCGPGGMDQGYGTLVRPGYGSGPNILSCSHMIQSLKFPDRSCDCYYSSNAFGNSLFLQEDKLVNFLSGGMAAESYIQLKKLYNNCIFRCVKANSRFNMIPTLELAQWFRLAQSRNFLSTPCSLLLVTWVPPQNSILFCIPHGVVLSVRRSSIFGPTLTTRTGSG